MRVQGRYELHVSHLLAFDESVVAVFEKQRFHSVLLWVVTALML
jgi:predicted  nucleic acid-binding Zn-ribbon protein